MASNDYVFAEVAKRDLDETLHYISNVLRNPLAAKNFFDRLTERINEICAFPKSCPLVENDFVASANIRKAMVNNYVLYYFFDEIQSKVWILRIVYGMRNLEEILKSIVR